MSRAHFRGCAIAAVLAIGVVATYSTAQADYILTDQNSTATLEPDGAGWTDWTVDSTTDHMTRQAFWARWGTMTSAVNLATANGFGISSIASDGNGDGDDDRLYTEYTVNSGGYKFKVVLDYTLAGGEGTHTSDMALTIRVVNQKSTPLNLSLFQFTDYSVMGTAPSDTLYYNGNIIQEELPGVIETSISSLQDPTIHFGAPLTLLDELDDPGMNFSDNSGTTLVGVDAAYVLQWNFSLGGNRSVLISEDTLVTVPEPTTMALLAMGGLSMVGAAVRRRRSA